MIDSAKVTCHYTLDGLAERLRAALDQAGLGSGQLSIDQLAPLDQFHSRGLAATVELASLLQPSAGTKVVDIGSGLGGPSRYLAAKFGCIVSGVDLNLSYVEAANELAVRTGLSERVSYQCANALAMPFADGAFDLAWTQHVAMNIADRAGFYAEAWRVLRPGGQLAIYDVVAGHAGEPIFPVPWSRDTSTSFLQEPVAMREMLERQGFKVVSWIDRAASAITWFEQLHQNQAEGARPSPLGLHLVMGPDFRAMTMNLARNLKEQRIGLVETVLERPA